MQPSLALEIYSTNRSKAVVPVFVLLFFALWFILRGYLLYVLPCVILVLCFSVILALRLPRLGKRELTLVLFGRLFDLCLFSFVGFIFLWVSGKSCDLFYVLPCIILFLICFSVLLALRLPRLGKRELILELFIRLLDLCLFGFVGFLFLLVYGKGCGLWLWHSLEFSLTFFVIVALSGLSLTFFFVLKVLGNCINSWSLPSFLFISHS